MRDGWVETTLGQVISLEYGKSLTDSNRDGVGYPVYGSAGVVGRHSQPLVPEGPVIVVGRKGTAGAVYWSSGPCFVIDTAYFARIKEDVQPKYLFYLLNFVNLKSVTAQTGVPGLNRERAYSLRCSIPPRAEQVRVVDLISTVDSYIEALQQHLESARKSRAAVLHDLLTHVGDDWVNTTIGEVSSFVTIRLAPKDLSSDSIYVGLEHLEPFNSSVSRFDSVSKVSSSLTPFEPGDVLFGRLRPYLHKVAFAEISGFCSPEILVLRANSEILSKMLFLYCDLDSTIQACVEKSAGTRMPRASAEDLQSIKIQLPPRPEQERISGIVSAYDSEIRQISHTLSRTANVRAALLSDLLSGEHEIPVSYDQLIGPA